MQYSLFEPGHNILPCDGFANYYPGFFTEREASEHLRHLLQEVSWQQEPIKIFGREIMQPRLTAWFGDENKTYTYSGITMLPSEWTETLIQIKQKIETVAPAQFNSVLLNLYRDGKDSMGWHRDNEKALGIHPVIGSVSFGATRSFQLRRYNDKSALTSIELAHGSLLLMSGQTQHYWEHRVPKTNRPAGNRVNLTFRVIV